MKFICFYGNKLSSKIINININIYKDKFKIFSNNIKCRYVLMENIYRLFYVIVNFKMS